MQNSFIDYLKKVQIKESRILKILAQNISEIQHSTI